MTVRWEIFKSKTKRGAAIAGRKFSAFLKTNYLMCSYIFATTLIELTGIAVTAERFYMTSPWVFLALVAFVCLVAQYIPKQRLRYALFLVAIVVQFAIDLIFIVVYNSTGGTVFDYAMLNLHNDAMRIVEIIPLSFTYVFVSCITIALYATLGFMFTKRIKPMPLTRKRLAITAAITATLVGGTTLLSYYGNYRYDSNDLSYKLYQEETSTYSHRGIIGNFYNELVRGIWFSDIDVGNYNELHDFVYDRTTAPTYVTGIADGYNVVTILCESLEWFTFLYDSERYPNGYAGFGAHYSGDDVLTIRSKLKQLFPNLYRMYESNATVLLDNSYSLEKTDVSENKSIIGNYPLYEYINYKYPTNTLPYSLPNILKSLYGVESNSFHNGYKTFYNRNQQHTVALGFNSFTAAEDIFGGQTGGGVGERNLDSEMFEKCKTAMFPTDRRFNTYITTITMHGQYAYRANLRTYYEKLDSLGILPYDGNNDNRNALRFYCAAGMDTDKAIGIMLDYLEQNGLADKTLITLFGDHSAYYQGISNYVKNIYSHSAQNYTELYRIPVMIKVGEYNMGNRAIDKFTCTSDIYPTILDLLGITTFANLNYGTSAFDEEESILYSRAYDKFLTDKIYFNTLSSIIYKSPEADDAYIEEIESRAKTLLEKISHVNRLFAADFFKPDKGEEFYTRLKIINDGRTPDNTPQINQGALQSCALGTKQL